MRIHSIKKQYYLTYVMKPTEFDMDDILLPSFRLRLWNTEIVHNSGDCRIPGAYYFSKDNFMNEMAYVACIFDKSGINDKANYLTDAPIISLARISIMYTQAKYGGVRIITPYLSLPKVKNILCLSLNIWSD